MKIRLGACLLIASLPLSACSGADEPTVLPPIVMASAPPAPSPTVTTIPQEAVNETAQGATAFLRYFFAQVNDAYVMRSPEQVLALSDSECGSCDAVADDIARLVAADTTVAGQRYVVQEAEASPPNASGEVVVDFRFSSEPYVELDAAGAQVQTFPALQDQDGQALLGRVRNEWRLLAIRLVAA